MDHHGSRSTQTSPSLSLPYSDVIPPPRPTGPVGPSGPSGPSLPRVHRPRLAILTPPPPTTITLQPLASMSRRPNIVQPQPPPPASPTEVSLNAPRPDNDRITNEYVETPFRSLTVHFASKSKSEFVRGTDTRASNISTSSVERTRNLNDDHHQTLRLPIVHHCTKPRGNKHRGVPVITKQPGTTTTFKKDVQTSRPTSNAGSEQVSGSSAECNFRGSIICPACGRCRCESCREPRPLPSRWLCEDACFCSSETIVDYASCLCCIKGLFYHCSKDYELDRDDDGSCADDPCSCASHRIYTRWGCLSVLAMALPCLLCYWPLKGFVSVCEKCYSRYTNQGCRCESRESRITDLTPEKSLLNTTPDF